MDCCANADHSPPPQDQAISVSKSFPAWTSPSGGSRRTATAASAEAKDRSASLDAADPVRRKVVIRLLNADKAVLPIEDLGLALDNLRVLQSFLSRPRG
jgi:hypothetical protein